MKKILVICTRNACRSQMAEGWLRYYTGDRATVFSAGLQPHGVNPVAKQVMAEAGVDISSHTSDPVDKYLNIDFDHVITVCDNASELCPVFPKKTNVIHKNFDDPSKFTGTEEEIKDKFRVVRDKIKAFCRDINNEIL